MGVCVCVCGADLTILPTELLPSLNYVQLYCNKFKILKKFLVYTNLYSALTGCDWSSELEAGGAPFSV